MGSIQKAGVLGLLLSSGLQAQRPGSTSQFRPTIESPFVAAPVAKPQGLSLGLSFSTLVLMGRPYSSKASGQVRDFRYQIPTSVGVEMGFNLSSQFELGVNASYMSYESRVDQPAGTGSVAFQTVKYKAYPIILLARYRMGDPMGWAPEFEGGLGYSFGTVKIRSTNISAASNTASSNALMGYGAAGFGFAWIDNMSLHMNLGYGYIAQPNKTYSSFVTQKSLSGVFSKALLKYQF